ncbi:MAG: hypothetical protein ACK4HV_02375, partial [Parachlamydiaceae bacterium]
KITIVTKTTDIGHNFEEFLLFGKISNSKKREAHYRILSTYFDDRIEMISNIAATLFISADEIVLFHWHILKGKKVEDEYHFKYEPVGNLRADLLFNKLLSRRPGPDIRRVLKA